MSAVTFFIDKQGFLISPSPYTYDFESVGEINIIVTPALKQGGKVVWGETTNTGLYYENISTDELVEMAVKEAKSKGADALVNFSITLEDIRAVDSFKGGVAPGYRYYVKGYCIKRK